MPRADVATGAGRSPTTPLQPNVVMTPALTQWHRTQAAAAAQAAAEAPLHLGGDHSWTVTALLCAVAALPDALSALVVARGWHYHRMWCAESCCREWWQRLQAAGVPWVALAPGCRAVHPPFPLAMPSLTFCDYSLHRPRCKTMRIRLRNRWRPHLTMPPLTP